MALAMEHHSAAQDPADDAGAHDADVRSFRCRRGSNVPPPSVERPIVKPAVASSAQA